MPKTGITKRETRTRGDVYDAYVQVGVDALGKRQRRTKRGFRTQRQAEIWRAELLAGAAPDAPSFKTGGRFS